MMMTGSPGVRISWGVCLAALLGCSTGTGGSGSGSTSAGTCQGACENFASLPCAQQDGGVTGCVSTCQAEFASTASCASQAGSYLSCLSTAPLTCDANGTPNTLKVCVAESRAYSVCAACLPASSDDACDTCTKTTCCAEYKAAVGDPHFFDYADCISACSDIACITGCDAKYPTVLQASQNLGNCQVSNCTACGP